MTTVNVVRSSNPRGPLGSTLSSVGLSACTRRQPATTTSDEGAEKAVGGGEEEEEEEEEEERPYRAASKTSHALFQAPRRGGSMAKLSSDAVAVVARQRKRRAGRAGRAGLRPDPDPLLAGCCWLAGSCRGNNTKEPCI
eukprot:COSAG01_NODE_11225_length_1978_cov_16.011708_2_plen_139_part_00